MDKDELRERSLELKEEGLSIRGIAKKLSDETGESISKSSVDRALKRPAEPVVETGGPPGVKLPTPSGKRMSKAAQRAESRAQELLASETVAELETRQKSRERESQVELAEREAAAARIKSESAREELEVLVARAKLEGPSEETRGVIAELQVRAETAERRQREAEDRAREERHLGEMRGLREELRDLHEEIGKNRTGKGEFDVISEGLQAVNSQLASMQTNLFAWLNKNTTLQQFNPQRKTAEQRKEAGEELIKKVEKAKSMPSCYQAGVGGYCASENAGRLPQCGVCRYMPKETMIGRGETGPLS